MSNDVIVETIDRLVRNRKVLNDLFETGAHRTDHENHSIWLVIMNSIVMDEELLDGELEIEEPGARLV